MSSRSIPFLQFCVRTSLSNRTDTGNSFLSMSSHLIFVTYYTNKSKKRWRCWPVDCCCIVTSFFFVLLYSIYLREGSLYTCVIVTYLLSVIAFLIFIIASVYKLYIYMYMYIQTCSFCFANIDRVPMCLKKKQQHTVCIYVHSTTQFSNVAIIQLRESWLRLPL